MVNLTRSEFLATTLQATSLKVVAVEALSLHLEMRKGMTMYGLGKENIQRLENILASLPLRKPRLEWQREWDQTTKGRRLYNLLPNMQ